MTSFSSSYSLNSSSEILNCWLQLLLRYSSLNERHFQRLRSLFGEQQASVSNMYQTLKSIGLKSDDEGSHNFLFENREKLSLHQAWVLLEVLEGTPYCWKVKSSFLKFSFISCKAGAKMSMIVHICFDFGTLFHKNQSKFSSFWHCSPNHGRC